MERAEKIELILTIPNDIASIMLMFGFSFYANLLFSVGFIPFIVINFRKKDAMHLFYFTLLWVLSLLGVTLHLLGFNLEDYIKIVLS